MLRQPGHSNGSATFKEFNTTCKPLLRPDQRLDKVFISFTYRQTSTYDANYSSKDVHFLDGWRLQFLASREVVGRQVFANHLEA